jgi:hypothetical protein
MPLGHCRSDIVRAKKGFRSSTTYENRSRFHTDANCSRKSRSISLCVTSLLCKSGDESTQQCKCKNISVPEITNYTTPNETTYSPKPADFDDSSNLDPLFDQYLRSPSPSPPPSPDDGASELSGATLIDAERDESRITQQYKESLALEDAPEGQVARDQVGPCRVANGTRIRLRVSQPKIMLRLKLQDPGKPQKKKKQGTNRNEETTETRRKNGKKGKR